MSFRLLILVFIVVALLLMGVFFLTFGDKLSYNLMMRCIWALVFALLFTGGMFLAAHYGWIQM